MSSPADLPPPYTGSLTGPPPPGVKLACASCIRGHRTSSCSHKDGSKGPLYPIRSKGRPPTQCDFCRQKRKESGRHVRCDCAGKRQSTTNSNHPLTDQHRPKKRNANASLDRETGRSSLGSHSAVRRKAGAVAQIESFPSPSQPYPLLSRSSSLDQTHAFGWPSLSSTTPIGWDQASPKRVSDFFDGFDVNRQDTATDEPSGPLLRDRTSLSLSSLMNPCRCSITGYCTCCKDSSKSDGRSSHSAADGHGTKVNAKGRSACCVESACCASTSASPSTDSPSRQREYISTRPPSLVDDDQASSGKGGCCSGTKPASSPSSASRSSSPMSPQTPACRPTSFASSSRSPSAPSIELLLQAVDMSTEFVPPKCGCGDNCRCPSCLRSMSLQQRAQRSRLDVDGAKGTGTTSSAASATVAGDGGDASPRSVSATDCDSCVACDLSLSKPSGIGAVDQWIEQERERERPGEEWLGLSPGASAPALASEASDEAAAGPDAQQDALELPPPALSVGAVQGTSASASPVASVPNLHGGLLSSSDPANRDGIQPSAAAEDDVRAELVLVHPGCSTCLDVVRKKGVGILRATAV